MHDPAEESAERSGRGSGTRITCRRAYATSEPEPIGCSGAHSGERGAAEQSRWRAHRANVVSLKASMEHCERSIVTLSVLNGTVQSGRLWPLTGLLRHWR
jgi:hypothetical protein